MPNLGTLTLDLIAKISGFTRPLDKAERKSQKTAKQIARHQAKMRAEMKRTVKQATMWGAAMGVAAVTAAAHFVKSSIDAADKAAKTSRAIGITAEAFQGLAFAASLGGVEQDKLANGMKRLSAAMYDADSGLKTYKDYFRDLGITIRDAKGEMKSADEVLLETADVFKGMPDGVKKTALAMKLFGKSGADMIPLLNGGKKSIKELMEKAKALGIVMSDEAAKQSEDFNDSLTVLKATSGGLWNQVTVDLLPALNKLTGKFIDVTEEGDSVSGMAEGISSAFKGMTTVVVATAGALNLAGQHLGTMAAIWSLVIEGRWKSAAGVAARHVIGMEDTLNKYVDVLKGLWDETADPETSKKIKERADALDALNNALTPNGSTDAITSKSSSGSFIGDFLSPIDKELKDSERERRKRVADSIAGLKEEFVALSKTESAQKKYQALQEAGVKSDSKAGAQIISLVEAIEKRKQTVADSVESEKKHQKVLADGASVTEHVRTSAERFGDELQRLSDLQVAGAIDAETYSRALAGMIDTLDFTIAPGLGDADQTTNEIQRQRAELDSWYNEQMQMLTEYRSERGELVGEWNEKEIEINQQYAQRLEQIHKQKYQKINDAFTDTFVAGFKGQVDSIGDIWRSFLDNMYTEFVTNLARMAAEKILFGGDGGSGLVGLGMSLFGGGSGGGGSAAPIDFGFAANGGLFPGELRQVAGALGDGGVGYKKSHWQLFEKGPEAVIPLSNPNAVKPIVNALGGGGNSETHFHTTVYANDAKSFRDQLEQNNDIISMTAARVASKVAPGAVANNINRRGVMSKFVGG